MGLFGSNCVFAICRLLAVRLIAPIGRGPRAYAYIPSVVCAVGSEGADFWSGAALGGIATLGSVNSIGAIEILGGSQ